MICPEAVVHRAYIYDQITVCKLRFRFLETLPDFSLLEHHLYLQAQVRQMSALVHPLLNATGAPPMYDDVWNDGGRPPAYEEHPPHN
jgi:hypothetical protein